MITLIIEGTPPSTNQSLMVCRGRLQHTVLSRSYRKHTTAHLITCLEPFSDEIKTWNNDTLFCLSLSFFCSWYTQKGKLRKKDVGNLHKLAIDSLFDALKHYNDKLDDCQIHVLCLNKQDSQEASTHIGIELV